MEGRRERDSHAVTRIVRVKEEGERNGTWAKCREPAHECNFSVMILAFRCFFDRRGRMHLCRVVGQLE